MKLLYDMLLSLHSKEFEKFAPETEETFNVSKNKSLKWEFWEFRNES